MAAELPRLSWYGDPESLDLRDALAAKHGCRPTQIVVGSGIDDLMGLAVRAFVATRRAGADDARNVSDLPLSRHRLRRSAVVRELSRRRLAGSRSAARRSHARKQPKIVYLANPDNPERAVRRARRDRAFLRSAAARHAACSSTKPTRTSSNDGELLPPTFDDRLDPLAHVLESLRHGRARASATRCTTRAQRRDISKDSPALRHQPQRADRRAGLAAATTTFRELRRRRNGAGARRLLRARARARAAATSSRARTSSASIWARAQRATAVMDELLARGVWIRKPGAPPLDRYIRVSAGTRADARAPSPRRCARCCAEMSVGSVRYAIVSDVHGNLESLAARARGDRAPTTPSSRLGDVVGYGPNPNECVAKLRERCEPRGARQSRSGGGRKLRRGVLQRGGARGDRLDANACSTNRAASGSTRCPTSSASPSFCWCTARR